MKTKLVTCGAVFMAISMTATLRAEHMEGKAMVKTIHGTPKCSTGTDAGEAIKAGAALKSGGTIKTDADSSADIAMGSGSMIRVTPNSEVTLGAVNANNTGVDTVADSTVNVKSGRILGHVKKQSAASKYEIKLPYGTARIHGTSFSAGDNSFTVIEGKVGITPSAGGNEVIVNAGQTYTPGSGVAAATAEELASAKTELGTLGTATATVSTKGPNGELIPPPTIEVPPPPQFISPAPTSPVSPITVD